ERAVRLELQQRRLAERLQAVDLAPQRAVAVADVVDPLEEVPLLHATLELLGREEVVVHAVLLARTPLARGCGHGKRELGEARQHELNKRALSCTRRPGDDEDRERMALSRRQASSVRRRRP